MTSFLISLFNSNFFVALSTIVAAGWAFLVYNKSKTDNKMQAARVLLMEIRNAEERINQIKQKIADEQTNDLPSVLTQRNWKHYSHLFVSDFDQDELKLITNFFDYSEIIEDLCKRNNDFFWITTEERAKVTQQKLAELVIHAEQNPETSLVDMKRNFLDKFVNDGYSYAPQKTINVIKLHLDKIEMLTTASCGVKLKKIACLQH